MLVVPRHLLRIALPAVAALALGACGIPKDDDVASSIGIQEFAFNPDPYRAEAGDEVQVVNLDGVTHTLTADDGSVSTGRLESRGRATITIDETGIITYHCEIHPYMRGVIRVVEPTRTT
jgi:plastocyanin